MIRALMTLICCLFVVPAFSYDEAGKDFAERLLDEKYGRGNYPKGPNSEFNKIKKWGDRSWQ